MARKKRTEDTEKKTPGAENVEGLRAEVTEQPVTETLETNFMPYAMSVIPGIDQVLHIPLDGGPVDLQAVIAPQLFRNLLLRHGMKRIRIFLQDLQDVKNNNLLPDLCKHMYFSPFITGSDPSYPVCRKNTTWKTREWVCRKKKKEGGNP